MNIREKQEILESNKNGLMSSSHLKYLSKSFRRIMSCLGDYTTIINIYQKPNKGDLLSHTVLSLIICLQIGIRGATLKALEEKIVMAVARVNKERRRDGGNESTRLANRKLR